MGKALPFGPGHPDWENQLDLFDSEPVATESDADPEPFPWHARIPVPCPECVQPVELADVQPGVDGRFPIWALSGAATAADPACLLCQGKAVMDARLAKAEGLFWDHRRQQIVKAASSEAATRKLKHSDVVPLYSEHGGYSAR